MASKLFAKAPSPLASPDSGSDRHVYTLQMEISPAYKSFGYSEIISVYSRDLAQAYDTLVEHAVIVAEHFATLAEYPIFKDKKHSVSFNGVNLSGEHFGEGGSFILSQLVYEAASIRHRALSTLWHSLPRDQKSLVPRPVFSHDASDYTDLRFSAIQWTQMLEAAIAG